MKYIEFLMTWVWRLLYLNILWILFSLPLITIFPSTFTLLKMTHQFLTTSDQVPTLKVYKNIFITQLRRSYLFSIPALFFLVIIWLDFNILQLNISRMGNLWFYMIAALSLLLFVVLNYGMYLLVSTDLSIRQSLTVGFVLSVRYPLHAVLILIAYIVVATLFLLQTGIGLLLIGSVLSLILCLVADHALQHFEQKLLKQSL